MTEVFRLETTKCNKSFAQCTHANRIKVMLQRYGKIISDKIDKSDQQLQNETNDLIDNVQILNDFYHIKYDHNINDSAVQFDLFHKYLFGSEHVLRCDISCCQSARRYYERRNRSFNSHGGNINSLHVICRIHTYLIHAYETDRLTIDEIEYIEGKLSEFKHQDEEILDDKKLQMISKAMSNKREKLSSIVHVSDNSKYMTSSDHECLNFKAISSILKNNGILIEENHLTDACEAYVYHKKQLIDDLCNIMLNG
eukprot:547549_1